MGFYGSHDNNCLRVDVEHSFFDVGRTKLDVSVLFSAPCDFQSMHLFFIVKDNLSILE